MIITRASKTIVVYTLTGQADFVIPFDYLARKFITVTLLGKDRKVLQLNTDYRFTTKTQITLNNPSPADYEQVEIRRFTSATERLVNFHDGSILRAYDLNLSQIQTLHVAEEARDLAGDSIGINDEGELDARGRKIVNLGDATEDNDAVNLSQLRQFDTSTGNNADRAAESARQAANSESVSREMERLSGLSRDAALVSEDKAKISEDNALVSEGKAKVSEINTKVSEINTKVSEINAKASEVEALRQADRAEAEADKLANLNDFAQSLDSVTDTATKFNRDVQGIVGGTTHSLAAKADQTFVENQFNSSSSWASIINRAPRITEAGIMEVGKYIDFHDVNSGTDFDCRLELSDTYLDINNKTLRSKNRVVAESTNHGFESAPFEAVGNGSAWPTYGFNKPNNFAGVLRMENGAKFAFRKQDEGLCPVELGWPDDDNCATTVNWVKDKVGSIYKGNNNKEVNLPIGHAVIAWIGNQQQDRVNNHVNLAIVSDNTSYPRYSVRGWYDSHNITNMSGTWQFRGYVYTMMNVQTGLLVRIA